TRLPRVMVSGRFDTRHLHDPVDHRTAADALLPPLYPAGVCGHEGSAVCSLLGRFFAQFAPLVGTRDGLSSVLAHGQEILQGSLPSAARIELGGGRRSSHVDAAVE